MITKQHLTLLFLSLAMTCCPVRAAKGDVSLQGTWKVSKIIVPERPSYKVQRDQLTEHMPGVGSVVTFNRTQMIVTAPKDEKISRDLKLDEVQDLGEIAGGDKEAKLLKVPGKTKFVMLELNDQACFGFIVMPDGNLYASFPLHIEGTDITTSAFEVWTPVSKNARMVLH